MNTKRLCILMMLGGVMLAGCAPYYSGSARPLASQTQYINLYHKDGTRKSYGTVKDGYINLYNPDGTRNSYGTVGR